jgi:hypothetical protein
MKTTKILFMLVLILLTQVSLAVKKISKIQKSKKLTMENNTKVQKKYLVEHGMGFSWGQF